ncbi:MAG: tetratricopeptide repeat protein, partial [Pseudomonadota bacterium]
MYDRGVTLGYAASIDQLAYWYRTGRGVDQDFERSSALARRAADQGNPLGLFILGAHALSGQGLKQDRDAARRFLLASSDLGFAPAMGWLGSIYQRGLGVPVDLERAAYWFRQGAEAGDPTSQLQLARAFIRGQGLSPDPAQALVWLEKASAVGNVAAMVELGALHLAGASPSGPREDLATVWLDRAVENGSPRVRRRVAEIYEQRDSLRLKAVALWRRGAQLGDRRSKRRYAQHLISGDWAEKDTRRGYALLREAADAGDVIASAQFGEALYSGAEIPQNVELGLQYLQRAARKNNVDALYAVALHFKSIGEDAQAAAWFQKAANGHFSAAGPAYVKGDAPKARRDAMAELGRFFQTGRGVDVDATQALQWFRQADFAGSAMGSRLLGDAYRLGVGVEVDLSAAMQAYARAIGRGDVPALGKLAELHERDARDAAARATARSLRAQAVEAGDAGSAIVLGEQLLAGDGVSVDPVAAFGWFQRADALGSGPGARRVGLAHASGRGAELDRSKAVLAYERAIARDDHVALYLLATLIDQHSVRSDLDTSARQLFEEAAERGVLDALFEVGRRHLEGIPPFDRNQAEGVRYLQRGADLGHVGAMAMLGGALVTGTGVEKNPESGVEYLRLAIANGGSVPAMYDLGLIYLVGLAGETNPEKALKYFRMAHNNGHHKARTEIIFA